MHFNCDIALENTRGGYRPCEGCDFTMSDCLTYKIGKYDKQIGKYDKKIGKYDKKIGKTQDDSLTMS